MPASVSRMTLRERLLAVLFGRTPDAVPVIADLTWWKAHHDRERFLPQQSDRAAALPCLLDLHRRIGVGIHLNCDVFWEASYPDDVEVSVGTRGDQYIHEVTTPVGSIREVRDWSDTSWSWGIIPSRPEMEPIGRTAAFLRVLAFNRMPKRWMR